MLPPVSGDSLRMKDTPSMFIVLKYSDNKKQKLSWQKVIFQYELYHQQQKLSFDTMNRHRVSFILCVLKLSTVLGFRWRCLKSFYSFLNTLAFQQSLAGFKMQISFVLAKKCTCKQIVQVNK